MWHWLRNFQNTVNWEFRKKSRYKRIISQSIENNFNSNCVNNIIDMILISKCTQKAFLKSIKIRNVLWMMILNSTVQHSNWFWQILRHNKCLIIIQNIVNWKFKKKSKHKRVISWLIKNNFNSNCINDIINIILISKCTQKVFSKFTKIKNIL